MATTSKKIILYSIIGMATLVLICIVWFIFHVCSSKRIDLDGQLAGLTTDSIFTFSSINSQTFDSI